MAAVSSDLTVHVGRGRGDEVLAQLGPALDELLDATDAPITARRTWLTAWSRHFGEETHAVTVTCGERLDAVALLATSGRWGVRRIVALGDGRSDRLRLPARSPAAAEALVEALAAHLRWWRGGWALRLAQLPVGDPVAAALHRELAHSVISEGGSMPVVRFGPERTLAAYASKNLRRHLRRIRNRVADAGIETEFHTVTGAAEVEAVLDRVATLRHDRDRNAGRLNPLRRADADDWWDSAIVALATRDEAEITYLTFDGELVAYLVGLLDGATYRCADGRFAPKWASLSPGHLVDTGRLEQLLADERWEAFDWMMGEGDYKMRTANVVEPTEQLMAWSSARLRSLDETRRSLRHRVAQVGAANPGARRAWHRAKALVLRTRQR